MKGGLFLSSYIPLYVMYLIVDFDGKSGLFKSFLAYIFIFFFVYSSIFLYVIIRHLKKEEDKLFVKIISIENKNDEVVAYLVTYVLPFLSLPNERKTVVVLIFMLMLFILYVKSNLIAINPILVFLGYHIMEVTITKKDWQRDKKVILISRHFLYELKKGEYINITKIQGNIYFLRGKVDEE